jgi:hypothetical protein
MSDRSRDLTAASMSKDERSFLLYVETQCVDAGGLLEGIRMNEADHEAAIRFEAAGLMRFGRMPARLLGSKYGPQRTHYAELTDAGWELAGLLRRRRSEHRGPLATEVFAEIEAIEKMLADFIRATLTQEPKK